MCGKRGQDGADEYTGGGEVKKLTLDDFMKEVKLRRTGDRSYTYDPEHADTAQFGTPDGLSSLYIPVDCFDEYQQFIEDYSRTEMLFNSRAKYLLTRLKQDIAAKIADGETE